MIQRWVWRTTPSSYSKSPTLGDPYSCYLCIHGWIKHHTILPVVPVVPSSYSRWQLSLLVGHACLPTDTVCCNLRSTDDIMFTSISNVWRIVEMLLVELEVLILRKIILHHAVGWILPPEAIFGSVIFISSKNDLFYLSSSEVSS